MEKPRHPHDYLFRQSFGIPEVALDYLRNFLPPMLVSKLNFDAIERVEASFISRKLRAHISDIIYRCSLKEKGMVYLTFLFEHKSKPEAYPHLQLLRYMLEAWERAIYEKKPLPMIVPIIVYHGKTRWDVQPVEAYFDDWDEALRPYLPAFDYLLTDLSSLNDEAILQLRARFLINVFLSLKHQGEKDYLRDRIRLLFYGLDEGEDKYPEKNYIQMLLVYMLCTTDFSDKDWENLVDETPSPVKQLAMSTYDLLIKKGKELGIELGKEQGIELGKEQGIELGAEKKAREVVLALLSEFPEFSNARIAALAKVEEAFVRELRG